MISFQIEQNWNDFIPNGQNWNDFIPNEQNWNDFIPNRTELE